MILTRTGTEKVVGHVTVINSVIWIDPTYNTVVQGSIPSVSPDGAFVWEGTESPPPSGIQYTVTGRRNPEYFLYRDLPQDRAHFGGLALPRRVALRRFDLFGRSGTQP